MEPAIHVSDITYKAELILANFYLYILRKLARINSPR